MKAAILEEVGKPLVIKDIEIPSLGRGQVLVKIIYSGLCGSQINEINGKQDKYIPHLLGHEASGIVEDIGEGVTKVKKGDTVVCTWIKGEGLEGGPKKYGKYNAGPITTFQEYSVISENRLVKVNNNIPYDKLSLFGCMIPTGAGSVYNLTDIKRGKDIVIVFGAAGNVGTSILLALNKLKPRKIIAIDKDFDRLIYAQEIGCTHIGRTLTDRQKDVIRYTANADYAFEATGNPEMIDIAYDCIKDTGKLILIGNPPRDTTLEVNPMDIITGRIVGSWGGFRDGNNTNSDKLITKLLDEVNVDKIDIVQYKLDDINQAIEDFNKGTCGKIVIACDR